jgi:hypothetical protein
VENLTQQEMKDTKVKIDKMYVALLGDDFGNKGIMDRLVDLEKEAELSKSFRQKSLAGLSFLVACGAILAWIGDKLFDIFKHK